MAEAGLELLEYGCEAVLVITMLCCILASGWDDMSLMMLTLQTLSFQQVETQIDLVYPRIFKNGTVQVISACQVESKPSSLGFRSFSRPRSIVGAVVHSGASEGTVQARKTKGREKNLGTQTGINQYQYFILNIGSNFSLTLGIFAYLIILFTNELESLAVSFDTELSLKWVH